MKLAIGGLGLGLVLIVGWMLIDLHAAVPADSNRGSKTTTATAEPAAQPAIPVTAPTPPLPIRPPPPSPPIAASPPATAPSPTTAPAAPEAEEPAATENPMDVVKMGKTVREWRHFYGERQRAIQEDMFKYEELLDREGSEDAPSAAQLSDARTRLDELKRRMRDDLVELRKIESSP